MQLIFAINFDFNPPGKFSRALFLSLSPFPIDLSATAEKENLLLIFEVRIQ